MNDQTARWFDDDAGEVDPPTRGRRSRVVLAVAALPWLVVAGVLARGDGVPTVTSEPARHAPAAAPEGGVGSDDAGPSPGGDGPSGPPDAPDAAARDDHTPDAAYPQVVRPGATAPGDVPELVTEVPHGVGEAVAIAVTRAWLSDAGPDLDIPGIDTDRRGYLEHVAVERIEVGAPDLAVATVTVVLLVRQDDSYVDALVRRAAVPLRVTATTVHPAGPPWWVPEALDLTPAPPERAPWTDPAARSSVTEALLAAGYLDPQVGEVSATPGGAVVADVSATTPSGEHVDGPVWLRRTTTGIAVLGRPLDAAT